MDLNWWLVKKALIDYGYSGFGDNIDQEWFEALDYGETEYNLVAARAYEDRRFAVGQMIENAYQAMITEDDKTGICLQR